MKKVLVNKELLRQVLDALEAADKRDGVYSYRCEINALRTALDAPVQECGYDETTGSCTRNPCCAVAPVQEPHKDLADAYCGAREDLAIWKKRALEAESELRNEIDSSHRLISELNAQNGPSHMGDPVCKPVQEPVAVNQIRLGYGCWSDISDVELKIFVAKDGWELRTLYAAPQPRKAVKLTEAEIHNADPMPHGMSDTHRMAFGQAIETAVLAKNGLES